MSIIHLYLLLYFPPPPLHLYPQKRAKLSELSPCETGCPLRGQTDGQTHRKQTEKHKRHTDTNIQTNGTNKQKNAHTNNTRTYRQTKRRYKRTDILTDTPIYTWANNTDNTTYTQTSTQTRTNRIYKHTIAQKYILTHSYTYKQHINTRTQTNPQKTHAD